MAIRGTQTVRFMQPGQKGDTGYDGCSVRISVWQAGKEYRNDAALKTDGVRYLDVVVDRAVSLYGRDTYNVYVCRKTHLSDSVPLAEGEYWEKADVLRPLITPLILAQQISAEYINVQSLAASQAFIDALTVKSMDTMPGQNGNKFVINGDEIKIMDSKGVAVGRIIAGSIDDIDEASTDQGEITIPYNINDIDCNNKWGTETVLDNLIPIGTGQMSQGDTFKIIKAPGTHLTVYRGPLNYNGSVSAVTNFRAEYTLYVSLYNGPTQRPDSFVERLYEESWTVDATDVPGRLTQTLYLSKSFTGDIPADGYYYLRIVVTCQVSGPGTHAGPYTFPAAAGGGLPFVYQRTNLTVVAVDGMLCRFGTTEQNRKFFKVSAADGSIEGRIGGYGFKVTDQGLVLYNNFYSYKAEENASGMLVFRKELS